VTKDSIQTRVVTFETAIHFLKISVETLFEGLRFLFIRHAAQTRWNDAQLRIATVTRFSWYYAPNTTVF